MSETDSFAANQPAIEREHSRKQSAFTAIFAVLFITATAGCAMQPVDAESAEYEREDARLEAMDQFNALARACRAAGGTIYIDRDAGSLPPTVTEIRSARCAEPLSSL